MKTNIKNLPEGKEYFTEIGYSQCYPWMVVKRTAKTVTLAKVNVEKDPEWIPKFIPGGFCAHCENQQDQTWLYSGLNEAYTKVVRLTKMAGLTKVLASSKIKQSNSMITTSER